MIYRVSKTENFVQIHKTLLYDQRISWKAKGILAHMLSRPDGWTFYETEMMKHAKDGRDALRSGIQELIEAGYLVKNKIRGEDGKFTSTETIVHEVPQKVALEAVESTDGFPVAGFPVAGFSDTSKIEGSKIEDSKKSSTVSDSPLFQADASASTEVEESFARIRSETSVRGMEGAARDALKKGATLSEVNALLAKRLPQGYQSFHATPRFALKLHSYENAKTKDDFKLASLWVSLTEDTGGVEYSVASKTFTELRGAYKKILLSKYSYEQCIWTLKRAVKNKSNLNFLVQGGRNLVTLVQQNGREYQALREAAKQSAALDKIQEERRRRQEEKEENPVTINVTGPNAPLNKYPLLKVLYERHVEKTAKKGTE